MFNVVNDEITVNAQVERKTRFRLSYDIFPTPTRRWQISCDSNFRRAVDGSVPNSEAFLAGGESTCSILFIQELTELTVTQVHNLCICVNVRDMKQRGDGSFFLYSGLVKNSRIPAGKYSEECFTR